ncbi:VOC family protein [Plantactinospora sp. KBS50]|uniref:VOC family protein n=1 Tax=Plantactinospora sp. KBS50 TaxID=2024580 RepID=UPI000BAACFAF|nr:VOC family protein [Plantactinospora sp. KBS50]ASW55895.1 glyoxalase [Plantactinospora sp. KBS50]
MIHHVQLACPRGSEETLRRYYVGLLGLVEKPKPPALAARGGCWFVTPDRLDAAPAGQPDRAAPGARPGIELHLGVEDDFRPARKAHPGLLWPDLDALADRLVAAGYDVAWGNDEVPGLRRFHTHDPHGNRLEFLATG